MMQSIPIVVSNSKFSYTFEHMNPFTTSKSSSQNRGSQNAMEKKANTIRYSECTRTGFAKNTPVNVRSSFPMSETKQEFRTRKPQDYDVLFGRGGGINNHSGNIHFREIVRSRKQDYIAAKSKESKADIANEIIAEINKLLPSGGRFLVKEVMGSQNEWTGWWVQADQEKVFAKTSQALRERLQVPSKSQPPTYLRLDANTIESRGKGKRKEAPSQHNVHPSNKKIHELPYCDNSRQEESVNRPIITSMKGGHRGKQFIYRKESMALQDHRDIIVGNGRKIIDNTTIANRTPQTAPSVSVHSSREELNEELPHIVNHPIIPHGLTRSHSLALSDINGFEDFSEQNKFINPFENDSGAESPSKTNNESQRISDLRVTFKDVISEENKDHSGPNNFGNKAPNRLMSASERNEKTMTTPILRPSNSRNEDNRSVSSQMSKPRRILIRENSLAFSDDEIGDLDLNEKFENPFKNEL